MKKIILSFLAALSIASCQSSKETNLNITGNVDGLKKGGLYLEKYSVADSSFKSLDSIRINGDAHFHFETYIDEPQIMFLRLDDNSGDENQEIIKFFAEAGDYDIQTKMKNFSNKVKIETTSKNQLKYEEYNDMIDKFNNKNLDLIAAGLKVDDTNDKNQVLIDSLSFQYNSLLKRKYLYTVNFAVNNKDLEVSPYVTVAEVYDANVKYLDTIYKTLNRKVRKSLYGKELKELIELRKE
ncbi:MAG: DUF4369 domain-containing protein [Psychroflexus sp.]|nr:DUF4369 domain-containing protein [Psychroflexus sp.]MDN6310365.1 DUF4369 domain-containing protein [Psychroflexus sp.]